MTSNEILALIDKIAATPGKNDKIAMVKEGAACPEFVKVIEYAYNPFKTYGIIKIPGVRTPESIFSNVDQSFNDGTWLILDNLIARRLTGGDARDVIFNEINRLNEGSGDLFVRIIRKDLRAGFSESTCNKAVKGLIPEFPYQRCSLPKDTDLKSWPWADGVFSQEKADGMYANIDHEIGGVVRITSRQGSAFPIDKFPQIVKDIRDLVPGNQQHGEIVVLRDGVICKRQDGNGVLNSVLNGGDFAENERPVYMVWDQIPLTAVVPKGKHKVGYRARVTSLIQQLRSTTVDSIRLIPTKIVRSQKEAYAHAVEMMKVGKEGSIIKHPNAHWKDGTSKEQIKIKLEFEVDLKIVSIIMGKDGKRTEGRAGSLACESSCGALRVNVTVKDEAARDAIDANPTDWIGRILPVLANDIMEPSESNSFNSLYLPRMAEKGYRKDKTEADSLVRIREIKDAAIFGEQLMKEAA